MAQDTALAVNLVAVDDNSNALTYQLTRQPANGTLSGVAPALQYTPNAGFSGADSFEFRASDGELSGDVQ